MQIDRYLETLFANKANNEPIRYTQQDMTQGGYVDDMFKWHDINHYLYHKL